jgi:hypothetical protein
MKTDFGKRVLALTAALVVAAGMAAPAMSDISFADAMKVRSAASSDTEALKQAKQAYKTADSAYQALGFEFVNSRTDSTSSFEAVRSAVTSDADLSGYTDGMDAGVKDALKSDNIKKSIRFIRELNTLRARSDNAYGSVGTLKIDPDLMMYSAFSGYISESTYDHTLFRSYTAAPDNLYSECLAWGYTDPFDGWYWTEKAIYDRNHNAPYSSVGHYLNSVDASITTVGLTYSDGTSAMDTGTDSANDVTVDEFDTAFTAYIKEAEDKRDAAKAEYQRIYKAYKARRHVGKVTQKKPLAGHRSITVRWKKVKNAKGYQIRYYRGSSNGRTITVKGGKKTSKKIKHARAKNVYYIYVRAYRIVDGKKFYGKWSNVKYGYCW